MSHVAAKATEAAAPEAAEASTTAARRIADRPTHRYEATREGAMAALAKRSTCADNGERADRLIRACKIARKL